MDEENNSSSAAQALSTIIDVLGRLDDASRARVLKSVAMFFSPTDNEPHSHISSHAETPAPTASSQRPSFSQNLSPTPKQFLLEKKPMTDVERIACLAYYLTHFRETPYFSTLDLAKLNTEAAQPKFSNTSYSANNALNSGYLVAAARNARQISAPGEMFVMALPDREAARTAMTSARRKSVRRKKPE
jgi:hypothetical protein